MFVAECLVALVLGGAVVALVLMHLSERLVHGCEHPDDAHGILGCEVRENGGVCECMSSGHS